MGTENLEIFSIASDKCLIEEHEFGIVNGHLATNVSCRDVLSFRSLYAPPFVSSDFVFEIRLGGEKVPTEHYTWYPFETVRQGGLPGLGVTSDLVLAAGQRAVLLAVTIENRTGDGADGPAPVQCHGRLRSLFSVAVREADRRHAMLHRCRRQHAGQVE